VFIPRAAFGGAFSLAWFELFFRKNTKKVLDLPHCISFSTTTTAA